MSKLAEWFTEFDVSGFHYVNQHLRCKILDFTLPKITHLGSAFFTLSLLAFIIIFSENSAQTAAFTALGSLTLSHIAVHFIKKRYSRQRPYHTIPDVNLVSAPLKDFSFPSGHSTAAFSIAVTFSLFFPIMAFILLPLATFVAISRMYLGLHYPSDCIIGSLIGSLTAIFLFVFI